MKININEKDLRLTILGCFRYSLGSMTYMPSHTLQIIKDDHQIFRKQDWERFIQEINECDNLGMDCDKQTWLELKRFAIEKLSLVNAKTQKENANG